jgi:hypothetical protein
MIATRYQVSSDPAPAYMLVPSRLLQRKCAWGGHASGECEECRKKRLQHKSWNSKLGTRSGSSVPPIVDEILRSPGQPLHSATRAFMELRFGHNFSRTPVLSMKPQSHSGSLVIGAAHDQYEREADANASRVVTTTGMPTRLVDFGNVRVHTDSRAAESAHELGAHAYTVGGDIVFDSGRYAPQANEGRTLLAHELTHVLQQTGASALLQRQPKGGEKEKTDVPEAKIVGCDKDWLVVVQDAIKAAASLASRACQAFERDYPYGYEQTAMTANFGSLGGDQKSKIIERYKHVLSHLNGKTYTCAKTKKTAKEGNTVVDYCAEALCPGDAVTIFPDFGKETCPAGPVMLHEAIHNAGACEDVNKGAKYPPSGSEDNAYSYEYFALDVAAGYKTPELKKRQPTVPK